MKKPTCIAVDAMGGDHGLLSTVPAALEFLETTPETRVLMVGDRPSMEQQLQRRRFRKRASVLAERLELVHAPEVVLMDDSPSLALKNKRQSSMRLAIEAVRDGAADVAVSAGNTGALMAISRFVLRTLDGIDRPAIAAAMPGPGDRVSYMLDLGANVDCSAEHLLQFAYMGSALVTALGAGDRPTVGLLNVGEELIKGNEVVKQASELLRASGLHFVGNVEGNELFKSKTDVIVCDGFVGNVALKTSEGLAQALGGYLKEEFTRSFPSRLAALAAAPVLRRFAKRVDHRRYNGAALLGLRGVVFKSHGSADAYAFRHALQKAASVARYSLNDRLAEALAKAQTSPAVATPATAAAEVDLSERTALQ